MDIDDELLAEAGRAFNIVSLEDIEKTPPEEIVIRTVHFVVEEFRERRGQALERLRARTAAGGFDFDRLDELDR